MSNLRSLLVLFVYLICFANISAQYQSENLFYMVDTEDSFQSFRDNIDDVSVVAPQSFSISEHGVVYGEIDSRVLALAKTNNVDVIPLIVNPGFNRELFHNFLRNSQARAQAISMMVKLAKKYNFAGWQFDFENIHISDRDLFTSFYRETAIAFAQDNLSLSAAVVPTNTNFDLKTPYHRFLYEFWRGAYDLKALAEIGDFLSIMTYSQHTRRTPPGPVAGIPWMKEMIEYLLEQGIDPNKISLGIPFYSNYWYADYTDERGGFINGRGASYEKISGLVERYDAEIVWLQEHQTSYALWNHDGVFEYAFIEDQKSIIPKLNLAKQYNLRGISVWRLGQEDPGVWNVIKKVYKQTNQ